MSVLTQTAVTNGRVNLEYLVCDGASTDRTRDIVEQINSPLVQFISQTDGGMYEALAKGLQRATGDIVCYLNAGDYYHPCAFDIVAEVFENYQEVYWVTGWNMFYNKHSQMTDAKLPYRYRPCFLRSGLHGRVVPGMQQESTFWRRGLHSLVDFEKLASLKTAGDYFLWTQFAKEHRPRVIGGYLGGFKTHPGQLSGSKEAYQAEFRQIAARPRPWEWMLAWLDWLVWKLATTGLKRRLASSDHFIFDTDHDRWCPYYVYRKSR